MKRILFLVFFVIAAASSQAQSITRNAYTWSNGDTLAGLAINDTLALYSDLFSSVPQANLTWQKNYMFDEAEGIVKLRMRQDQNTCMPESFTCSVQLEVQYWEADAASQSMQTDTVTLTVTYDKRTGKVYNEQNARVFADAHYLGMKLLSVSNASVKQYLYLELQLNSQRYVRKSSFDIAHKPVIKKTELITGSNGSEIKITFSDFYGQQNTA
jgi:hypothetical protein